MKSDAVRTDSEMSQRTTRREACRTGARRRRAGREGMTPPGAEALGRQRAARWSMRPLRARRRDAPRSPAAAQALGEAAHSARRTSSTSASVSVGEGRLFQPSARAAAFCSATARARRPRCGERPLDVDAHASRRARSELFGEGLAGEGRAALVAERLGRRRGARCGGARTRRLRELETLHRPGARRSRPWSGLGHWRERARDARGGVSRWSSHRSRRRGAPSPAGASPVDRRSARRRPRADRRRSAASSASAKPRARRRLRRGRPRGRARARRRPSNAARKGGRDRRGARPRRRRARSRSARSIGEADERRYARTRRSPARSRWGSLRAGAPTGSSSISRSTDTVAEDATRGVPQQPLREWPWRCPGSRSATAEAGTAVLEAQTTIPETVSTITESGARPGRKRDGGSRDGLPETGTTIPETGTTISEAGTAVLEAGSAVAEAGTAVLEAGSAMAEAGTAVLKPGARWREPTAVLRKPGPGPVRRQGADSARQRLHGLLDFSRCRAGSKLLVACLADDALLVDDEHRRQGGDAVRRRRRARCVRADGVAHPHRLRALASATGDRVAREADHREAPGRASTLDRHRAELCRRHHPARVAHHEARRSRPAATLPRRFADVRRAAMPATRGRRLPARRGRCRACRGGAPRPVPGKGTSARGDVALGAAVAGMRMRQRVARADERDARDELVGLGEGRRRRAGEDLIAVHRRPRRPWPRASC